MEDATIYAWSAMINMHRRDSSYLASIEDEAERWRQNVKIQRMPIAEVIAYYTRLCVLDMGWAEMEVDGVSWFIMNLTDVAIKAGLANDFETAFKAAFNIYFNEHSLICDDSKHRNDFEFGWIPYYKY